MPLCEQTSSRAAESLTADVLYLASPDYIFFGGIVQLLGAIGEWITGNTFSCALFFTYGEPDRAFTLAMRCELR